MNNGLSGLFLCFTSPLMVSQEQENDGNGPKPGMDITSHLTLVPFGVMTPWIQSHHLNRYKREGERDTTICKFYPLSLLATKVT